MNSNELAHHGIFGMKWGVRRYQNKDGTLTAAGKKQKTSKKKTIFWLKEKPLLKNILLLAGCKPHSNGKIRR